MASSKGTGSRSSTSPLGDGSSGARGNSPQPFGGINQHAGPSPRQRMGNGRNPESVAAGGPVLKLDPPSDRQGQIGTHSLERGDRRPFRLTGGDASSAGDEDAERPVGEVPGLDVPTPDETA